METLKEKRADIKRRIKRIEANLRDGGKKTFAIKRDAHGRISELKAELRNLK